MRMPEANIWCRLHGTSGVNPVAPERGFVIPQAHGHRFAATRRAHPTRAAGFSRAMPEREAAFDAVTMSGGFLSR